MNKQWKVTEREVAELLDGKRVPLSGSNSGHDTRADVMCVPKWLYVEVKRDKRYNTFLERYRKDCSSGWAFVFGSDVGDLILFSLQRAINFPDIMCEHYTEIDYSEKSRVPSPVSLYYRELDKCKDEGREVLLLVFRIHNITGFLSLTEYNNYGKLLTYFGGVTHGQGKDIRRSREVSEEGKEA